MAKALDLLLAELAAERFASERCAALVERLGAPARLLRVHALLRRRRFGAARVDLQQLGPLAPSERLVAALLAFVAREHAQALALLRCSSHDPLAPSLAELAVRLAGELGWLAEQRERRDELAALPLPPALRSKLDAALLARADANAELARELDTLAPARAAERCVALVAGEGRDAALHALARLLARSPDDPALLGARIRVALVLGELDDAAEQIAAAPEHVRSEALAPHRAALALARGDPEQAIVRTRHAREPWPLSLRGAALLALGEFDAAAELLERARMQVPGSVTLTLALALARARGTLVDRGESLARRFDDLLAWAPALLGDAATLAGHAAWGDQGPTREAAAQLAIVAHAHALVTPERELGLTSYRVPGHPLRHVPRHELAGASHLARLQGGDRARLDQAERLLARMLGLGRSLEHARRDASDERRAPQVMTRSFTPRTLDADAIERFLVDGIVVLPGAFDRTLARRWVADANRRIRDEPERWVRGYDPHDGARDLHRYDPDDPETWTWPRIDLDGDQQVAVEQAAPRAWGAITDLLGGPERVATRHFTNYLIVNLRPRHPGNDLSGACPAPDRASWHIDDPSPTSHLDRIATGLIGIVLFSDLLPSSGNTWLALDSVGKVARTLADHPEGIDLAAKRGNQIVETCARFHEVTGETGDVVLVHPLMMHSGSPNPSTRIRWLGNPMIYLHEPLRPRRPEAELSPVERAIRRAIER